jgi:arylsulfatase A-like enzyme
LASLGALDLVVLISFDTTRADHVGAYGCPRGTTPTLDRLAREGLLFEQARATSPLTLPSHTSMLTGALPPAHGIRNNGNVVLAEPALLVQEVLREAGWRTGGFVGSMILDPRFGLAQGFEVYDAPTVERAGEQLSVIERRADLVVDRALHWLETVKDGERAFLFVHFYDPHTPYDPKEPTRSRFEDPYDAEIAFCDEQLARLLQGLESRGRDVAVVTTSDHGESLGEHGEQTHGIFVYDSTALVPLIVHAKGRVQSGRRVAEPVTIADVAPTLLELAGVRSDALPSTTGRSLLAALEQPDPARPIYVESLLPFHSYRWHPLQSLTWNGWKLIDGGARELFDLRADPREEVDLSAREPERVAQMAERLRALVAEAGSLGWERGLALSPQDRELLSKLGYAAGGGDEDPFDPTLPPPKERIGDVALSMRARKLVQQARIWMGVEPSSAAVLAPLTEAQRQQKAAEGRKLLDEARALLAQVRAANPRDVDVDKIEGILLLTLGDFAGAIAPLERLVTLDATQTGSRFNLALCYAETGKADWAVREMTKVVSIEPSFAKGYEWLTAHHRGKSEFGRAAFWLKEHAKHAATAEERARLDRAVAGAVRELERHGLKLDAPGDYPMAERMPEGVIASRTGEERE